MIGKENEYEAMASCEKNLWWYLTLHRLTQKTLRQHKVNADAKILDAGCGTGGLMLYLKKSGFTNISGFDFSSDAIKFAGQSGLENVRFLDVLDCDTAYEKESFDVIICNDLVCLLPLDKQGSVFAKLHSLIKPGGLLITNLPAGRFFRGTHDFVLHVRNRFSKRKVKDLTGKLFITRKSLYWPFFVSPAIFLVRLSQRIKLRLNPNGVYESDVKLPPPLLNTVLGKLSIWENDNFVQKPWGSSIFTVLQKPARD